jgi:hypothetical protein
MNSKTKTKLQTLLETCNLLQVVYPYEREDATGTPFATITRSAKENDYQTTSENHRVYSYLIRLFVERKGKAGGVSNPNDCEAAMDALEDAVIDILDKNHRLSGLVMNTGYTYLFMEAVPSVWGYVGRENEYRVAELTIRVHFSVDVNLI